MKLCLFDSEPGASSLWREIAAMNNLQVDIHAKWRRSDELGSTPQILVLDRSATPDFLGEIRQACLQRQLVVVATGRSLSIPDVVELMSEGVAHVFEKPHARERLIEAMPGLVERAQKLELSHQELLKLNKLFGSLTSRERDVLDCVLEGVSNRDAAGQLKVSVRTVESRRAKVYRKLQAKHLAEMVRLADKLAALRDFFGCRTKTNAVHAPHLRMHQDSSTESVGAWSEPIPAESA
ncbi:MAG: LuxR C-terminal-related transcriptional regulator [Pirellulaceae bacterium]